MENTDFKNLMEATIPQLKKGAFLISGEEANPMTIGWATFGIVWGKPICTVFVRQSRHSHKLMEGSEMFTVSVPESGQMESELRFCGTHSGRDTDKLKEADMSVTVTESGSKLLSGCRMHFVCKIVAKTQMDMKNTDSAILDKFYNVNQATPDGDPHTIYFGEIIESWKDM